ncbi:alpha/beta hydrolase fold domain-containing protein [Pseudomonas syringae]|uniref:alpha/beta hydrolase fold domain-containing protein n=1 Tax=Pseudomonas syringae TaxID=317 RepID=UPI001F454F9D|nr:alpha/beta hydrolase fold domain-containing protein [Pseudomonas syringae]
MNGDPKRLALAGESAVVNLALATAVAAHKAGLTAPKHVLSVYMVAQSITDTPSYLKYANAIPQNRPMMLWFVSQVTSSPAQVKDPRIDLVHANLTGLPPVTSTTRKSTHCSTTARSLSNLFNRRVKLRTQGLCWRDAGVLRYRCGGRESSGSAAICRSAP